VLKNVCWPIVIMMVWFFTMLPTELGTKLVDSFLVLGIQALQKNIESLMMFLWSRTDVCQITHSITKRIHCAGTEYHLIHLIGHCMKLRHHHFITLHSFGVKGFHATVCSNHHLFYYCCYFPFYPADWRDQPQKTSVQQMEQKSFGRFHLFW